MNTKTTTRLLGAAFCILAIFLVGRLLFPSPSLPKSAAPDSTHQQSPDAVKNDIEAAPPQKATVQTGVRVEKRTEAKVETADLNPPDPDEVFMKQVASLPLDRANLEISVEAERRIKTSEKDRAKLIFSEKRNGKVTLAYAVKQPSMQEITKLLKLYQMFLDRQTDPAARQYVDQRFQNLVRRYAMTIGLRGVALAILQ